jgi:hypothetical protein
VILSTDIWVSALIRRAQLGGAFAAVIRKGDLRAGAVLVKLVNRRDAQFLLFAEASTGDGNRLWMRRDWMPIWPALFELTQTFGSSRSTIIRAGIFWSSPSSPGTKHKFKV